MKMMGYFLAIGLSSVATILSFAQHKEFLVKLDEPVAQVSPTMFGVFFEDINQGADGGIYAELVKNRSFEFLKPLMGWKIEQKPFNEGTVLVLNRQEQHSNNPRFLRLTLKDTKKENLTLTNEGFKGMGIKKGIRYDFSFQCRKNGKGIKIYAALVSSTNQIIGATAIELGSTDDEWAQKSASFFATQTDPKAQLQLSFEGNGMLDLDMISLFPADTWKKRPGGMRADMIQMLADMKPGFIRFPGGCIVEGIDLANRYQWKKSIGPVEERQLIMNRWNVEFAHRPAPDYFQTFGLGFFEYFQLAEDIGAEPLPILNCGMACQFNTAELVPLNQLDPYLQDALDLIEFANGDIKSTWGKIRASMGHPQPFNLKMMGVGNENWGPQYIERLEVFNKVIKSKYPQFKIIASSGTGPEGERFDLLNTALRRMHIDFVDEHYYMPPKFFFENATRYDNYPRTGSKVFAGEYASHVPGISDGLKRNNWLSALSEAAFLTGLERNAAIVQMASYAPLFAHVEGWQWTPDLIWVDNLNIYGTPNYYVQKLYSLNKGTTVVPIEWNKEVIAGRDSLYASAVKDEATNELVIKMVNAGNIPQTVWVKVPAAKRLATTGKLIVLQSDDLTAVNSLATPRKVAPSESVIKITGKKPVLQLKPYSFSVLRIKY